MGYISNTQLKSVQQKIVDNLKDGVLIPSEVISAKSINPVSEESGTIQDNPFISQGTGTNNNVDSVDTSPVAKQIEKQGYTVANNQLIQQTNLIDTVTVNGVTFTNNNDGTITVTGTATASDYYNLVKNALTGLNGKYVLYMGGTGASSSGSNISSYTFPNGEVWRIRKGDTVSPKNSFSYTEGTTYNIKLRPRTVNLSQYFNGDANIPQDLLDNPSHWSWYDNGTGSYDAGSLKNASGRYLVCTHRQLYNASTSHDGYAINNSGNEYSASSYSASYYIYVVPNRTMWLYNPGGWISGYNKNKKFIGHLSGSNNIYTVPSDCRYVKLTVQMSSKASVVFSLYYSAEQGGEGYDQYYPYQEPSVYDTGTEELRATPNVKEAKLPNGKIAHTVAEISYNGSKVVLDGVEYTNLTNKAVMDIGGGAYVFYFDIPNMQGKYGVSNTRPSFNNFGLGNQNPFGNVDNFYLFGNSGDLRFAVAISGYTTTTKYDNLFASRPFVANVECFTGEEIQGTSFAENIEIDDYGMMYWLDTDGNLVDIPQGVKVFYPADYVLWLDTAVSTTNGDATDIALKSEITDTALAERGYNKTSDLFGILGANGMVGGVLRHLLATAKSIDYNTTKVISLDSLTFSYVSGWNGFQATISDYTNEYAAGDTKPNLICSNYKCGNYQETGPCIRAWSGLGTNAIIIIDSSLGTDPTSDTFKNGIKGMLLAYKKSS